MTNGAKGNIQITASQTPGEGTCDPAAQVIAASHKSETFDTQINLAFSHVTAYGNLSIVLPEGAGAVSNISLTSSKNIAGRFYYDFNGALSENSASSTISLLTNKVSDIFFACAPADLSGSKLDITVTTENGTYEKSIDLTDKTLKFESGKISKFTVNGFTKKESDEVYTLVTDASTLKIGDKVIIAAATADFAISTTQNTSNRGRAAVIKTNNNTIVNPGKDVQLFTLEPGTVDNTYAFNTGSGYIFAASSSANQLKTQQKNDNNGSWTISCTAEGVATITANGNNSRKSLKYNSSSSLFSCYASGQSAVAIYSDGKGTGSVPTPPVIKTESTSVSLNHNDETDHYMTISITGADAAGITCKVSENADGTGEAAWLIASYSDTDGKLSYRAKANTTNAARTAYIVLSASNADGDTSLAIKVTQNGEGGAALTEKTATINFGTNNVKIDKASVTATDDQKNSWAITTVGTTSFTTNQDYYQVGSSKKPATSITFTTILPEDAEVTSISAKFGGFNETQGTITLKVGDVSVGTGKLEGTKNGTDDVIVTNTSTAAGNKVTITVTNIAKGVKCYNIQVKYKTAN